MKKILKNYASLLVTLCMVSQNIGAMSSDEEVVRQPATVVIKFQDSPEVSQFYSRTGQNFQQINDALNNNPATIEMVRITNSELDGRIGDFIDNIKGRTKNLQIEGCVLSADTASKLKFMSESLVGRKRPFLSLTSEGSAETLVDQTQHAPIVHVSSLEIRDTVFRDTTEFNPFTATVGTYSFLNNRTQTPAAEEPFPLDKAFGFAMGNLRTLVLRGGTLNASERDTLSLPSQYPTDVDLRRCRINHSILKTFDRATSLQFTVNPNQPLSIKDFQSRRFLKPENLNVLTIEGFEMTEGFMNSLGLFRNLHTLAFAPPAVWDEGNIDMYSRMPTVLNGTMIHEMKFTTQINLNQLTAAGLRVRDILQPIHEVLLEQQNRYAPDKLESSCVLAAIDVFQRSSLGKDRQWILNFWGVVHDHTKLIETTKKVPSEYFDLGDPENFKLPRVEEIE